MLLWEPFKLLITSKINSQLNFPTNKSLTVPNLMEIKGAREEIYPIPYNMRFSTHFHNVATIHKLMDKANAKTNRESIKQRATYRFREETAKLSKTNSIVSQSQFTWMGQICSSIVMGFSQTVARQSMLLCCWQESPQLIGPTLLFTS